MRSDRTLSRMRTDEAIQAPFPGRVIEGAAGLASGSNLGRAPSSKQDLELAALVFGFGSEDRCRVYLERLRWPTGVTCPRCDASNGISRIEARGQFDCGSCGYQFSVRAGTILHASHLPLWKWFRAVYIMAGSRDGVSANRLKEMLGVSYKTAWFLSHRIRAAMKETNPEPLSGTVEADETLVGGKRLRRRSNYRDNKAMVMGVIQRDGKVRLEMADVRQKDLTREMAHAFLRRHTVPELERLITDEQYAYRGFADADTRHETVHHGSKEWARGDVHTNTVENIWSLLQRSIIGSYHKLSFKHLDAYLDELEWRFNNRRNPYLFRETLRRLLQSSSLPYSKLTAS